MILNGQIVTAVSIGGQVVAKRGLKGEKGDTGDTGATGNGISSAILNADYTLTLTFTNGTTYTTPSIRGQQGATGQTGATGDSGVYVGTTEPTDPSVMVWVDESDPAIVVNATVDGSTGTPTCDVTYDNEGLYFAFHNLKGSTGEKGDTGNTGATGNGIASISKTGTSGKVDTYTITFTNGTTTTFTVTNGNDGSSAWADITGKPDTFPPSSHNHNDIYYTETETDTLLGGKADKSDTYTKAQTDSAIASHHDSSKADASNVYTKTESDSRFALASAITDMATKTWVNAQGFITSLAGYATEAWVTAKNYATQSWVEAKGYLTEHQSLSAYRTSADQDVIDAGKVDKVEGKGLSTNDYTTAEKTKLSGIEANADVTDADNVKASGATMGVKVVGTELTKDADGKVNVPRATDNTFGVARIGDGTYGIMIDSDGLLRTKAPTDAQILAKTDYSRPLMSNSIDLAVKSGLTSNSQITATADKKACCGTIGAVYDGQYELIEEIILTEAVASIERTQDPNGVAYNFSGVFFKTYAPNDGWNIISYQLYYNTTNFQQVSNTMDSANYTYMVNRVYQQNGVWIPEIGQKGTSDVNGFQLPAYFGGCYSQYGASTITYPYIDKIKITSYERTFAVGTNIKIYAMRN